MSNADSSDSTIETSAFCPMLSVVTVVYNDAFGIGPTIRSVLSQTYPFFEYIVIDGDSKDGTMDVVRQFRDKIACVVSEKDKGISDAFNKGAALASGKAILFLNSGDVFFDTSVLASYVSLARKNGVPIEDSIICGAARIIGRDGVRIVNAEPEELGKRNSICHQATLIGLSIQRRFPYDVRLRLAMDYDFWLRARSVAPFFVTNQLCVEYKRGGISDCPAFGVQSIVYHALVRLLNSREFSPLSEFCGCAVTIAAFKVKKMVECILGQHIYLGLKRLSGKWQ